MAAAVVLALVVGAFQASPAQAGGAVFRTRPRFVEPGQSVAIRVSFGKVNAGTGGIAAGPYEVYVQRTRGRHGEVMGPEFHVGQLSVVETPRWGVVAYAKFVAPEGAGAGRYVINHRNAAGQSLEEITWGSVVIDPHPDAARRRYHREWRLQLARREAAERSRDLRNQVWRSVSALLAGIGGTVGLESRSPL